MEDWSHVAGKATVYALSSKWKDKKKPHDTISKAETILTKGTPGQIDRARRGGKGNSVNSIAREIKQKEQAAAPVGIDTVVKAYESSFDSLLRDLDKIGVLYADTIKHADGGKKQVSDLFSQKMSEVLAHLQRL